jgi:anti-anti-sigma regulatory factor
VLILRITTASVTTVGVLMGVLWKADGRPEIHIDLSGLRYCDLAGLRAILRLTPLSSRSRGARRAVRHAVPSQLAGILHILGWDSLPGIVLDD